MSDIVKELLNCPNCRTCAYANLPLGCQSAMRKDAVSLIEQQAAELTALREATRCAGCANDGMYEDYVESGYPSPCTGCKRRAQDNYSPLPSAPKEGTHV